MENVTHFHFDTIDSTTAWAKKNLHLLNQKKMNLITAEKQTKGRGREKRVWFSPQGANIYATFCFFLPKDEKKLANFTQVMAISLSKVLEKLHFTPKLKWPNDIMLSEKKLAGILCEIQSLEKLQCITVGVGLNVNLSKELLQQIDQPATSLFAVTGKNYDKDKILEALQKEFVRDLAIYRKNGFLPFFDDYNKRVIHQPNDPMKISILKQTWKGKFLSIEKTGCLKLITESGKVLTFSSGDVG